MLGAILLQYPDWFSITDQEQQMRFLMRIHDPMKQWKLSPMDLESRVRWEHNTHAMEEMLELTLPLLASQRSGRRGFLWSGACQPSR